MPCNTHNTQLNKGISVFMHENDAYSVAIYEMNSNTYRATFGGSELKPQSFCTQMMRI